MRTTLLFLISVTAIAVNAAPRSGDALKTELKDTQFTATLKEGFHFNEKAPNAVVVDSKTIQPAKISGREIEFVSLPKDWVAGRAALYVCDDALTFCETRSVGLKGETMAPKGLETVSKGSGKVNRLGFIEDDYGKALAAAQKDGKLLLIDFSARWCPGCIRLEKEIFGGKEFKTLTQDFVKLKIDVDRFENSILSEKFAVRGIPTLLVITAGQEEVDRMVDYQNPDVIQAFFAGVKADPISLTDLKAKAAGKDQATLYRLGKRLLGANRGAEALEYLELVKPAPAELLKARVMAAEAKFAADKNTKPAYAQALKDAVAAEPGSVRSLEWRSQLVTVLDDKNEAKSAADQGVALADSLLSDKKKLNEAIKQEPAGEFSGYEALYVAMMRADLVEASGASPEAIKAAWKRAAKAGQDAKVPITKEGVNLRHLIVLIKAEQYGEANRLVLAMMKINPASPELQRRRVKILLAEKKYEEAIQLGQMTIKNSYGRNEFWVAEMLAQAYVGAKRNKEAKKFIEQYLTRPEIGWTSMTATRKTMEDLKVQVNQ